MTVRELIEKLQHCPRDGEVFLGPFTRDHDPWLLDDVHVCGGMSRHVWLCYDWDETEHQ